MCFVTNSDEPIGAEGGAEETTVSQENSMDLE